MKGLAIGSGIVTFLSDFGWNGGYVATCEAVVVRVQPHARVLHISHEVAVGDVAAGSLVLERVAPFYPPAVHLAVIDPGVGTGRRPLALTTTRGDALAGPDNGLLPAAADALGGLSGAWLLDRDKVRSAAGLPGGRVSSTFHGRDLFAPAAALLSRGVDPTEYGHARRSGRLGSSASIHLAAGFPRGCLRGDRDRPLRQRGIGPALRGLPPRGGSPHCRCRRGRPPRVERAGRADLRGIAPRRTGGVPRFMGPGLSGAQRGQRCRVALCSTRHGGPAEDTGVHPVMRADMCRLRPTCDMRRRIRGTPS